MFHRTRTSNSKLYMAPPEILNGQNNLGKEDKTGGIMLPDFKLK